MVDFTMLKSGFTQMFYDKIHQLVEAIKKSLNGNEYVQLLPTLMISEEVIPYRGQGFEVLPCGPSPECSPTPRAKSLN